MITDIIIKAGTACACALALLLALLAGNGGTVPAWLVCYLGALALVSVGGLLARCGHKEV